MPVFGGLKGLVHVSRRVVRLGDQALSKPFLALLLGAGAILLSGCGASLSTRNAVPDAATQARAEITGITAPNVRFWGDLVPENPRAAIAKFMASGAPRLATNPRLVNGRPVVEVLALSGGGGDGAFGAGLLSGWSQRGDRPQFEVVTGVSAGAIIAPFAFLGPKYDAQLREVWTKYETKDLAVFRGVSSLFNADSLVDTTKLAELIASYLTRDVLDEIAREYRRGRILLVLTTNLDAQRPVVWNLGALASIRSARAANLFHKVILASAAIPGAFPPVNIEVTINGKAYDELHVDGGTTREVFISPLQVPLRQFDVFYKRPPIRKIYVVKNGRGRPRFAQVEQRTLPIAGRAISTLIHNQNAGEVYRIYRRSLDAGAEFYFTSIPATFPFKAVEVFDPDYQRKLFEAGVALGKSGRAWRRKPIDLTPSSKLPQQVELRPVKPSRAQGGEAIGSNTLFAGMDLLGQ